MYLLYSYERLGPLCTCVHLPTRQDAEPPVPCRHAVEGADKKQHRGTRKCEWHGIRIVRTPSRYLHGFGGLHQVADRPSGVCRPVARRGSSSADEGTDTVHDRRWICNRSRVAAGRRVPLPSGALLSSHCAGRWRPRPRCDDANGASGGQHCHSRTARRPHSRATRMAEAADGAHATQPPAKRRRLEAVRGAHFRGVPAERVRA